MGAFVSRREETKVRGGFFLVNMMVMTQNGDDWEREIKREKGEVVEQY